MSDLTLIDRVWRVDSKEGEVSIKSVIGDHRLPYGSERKTDKKNPWVVESVHPRLTSSVVVTFVHVIQRERTCPANRDKTNRLVHMLFHLRPKLVAKAEREVYSIGGRAGLWG